MTLADETSENVSSSIVVLAGILDLLELSLKLKNSRILGFISLSPQLLLLLVLSDFSFRSSPFGSHLEKISTDSLAC